MVGRRNALGSDSASDSLTEPCHGNHCDRTWVRHGAPVGAGIAAARGDDVGKRISTTCKVPCWQARQRKMSILATLPRAKCAGA
jgi:hypothetical protein